MITKKITKTILITGSKAAVYQAIAELLANIQYEKIGVTIELPIEKKDESK